MREWGNGEMGEWGNGEMGKWGNEEMRKLGNGEMRKLGNGEMQIMSEILIINFAKGASRTGSVSHTGKNFGKVYTPKSDTAELSEENE